MKEFLDNEELKNFQSKGRDNRINFIPPDIYIFDYPSLIGKKYNMEEKKKLNESMDKMSKLMDKHFVHIVMNDHISIPMKDHLGNVIKYYNIKVGGHIYNQLENMFGKKHS